MSCRYLGDGCCRRHLDGRWVSSAKYHREAEAISSCLAGYLLHAEEINLSHSQQRMRGDVNKKDRQKMDIPLRENKSDGRRERTLQRT